MLFRLKDRVLSQGGHKKCTKIVVYYVCMMTWLLYSCKIWVVYLRQTFWRDFTSTVYDRYLVSTGYPTCQTPWLKRLMQSASKRTVFTGQIISFPLSTVEYSSKRFRVSCSTALERKQFEDYWKESLATFHIEVPVWETSPCNRNKWIFQEYAKI